MANEREIAVTIRAYDEFTAQMEKFKASVSDASDSAVSKAGEVESRWTSATETLKDKWMELAGAYLSVEFLLDARKDALEAESAMNKLKMSVENLGVSWGDQGGAVQKVLDKTSEYAMVTEGDASKSLQTLIFHSGKYKESMENLNLVYDLAYMKGIDQHEAAMLVGKAMSGNVTALGRYIPELHNVNDMLGNHATAAEKATFALMLLKEKTQGAMDRMDENLKMVKEETKAMTEFKEAIGGVVLIVEKYAVATLEALAADVLYGVAAWEKFMAALSDAKAWLTHNTAAAAAAEAHRAVAKAIEDDANHLTKQALLLTGLTAVTEKYTNTIEQNSKKFAADVKARGEAEDADAAAEKERQAREERELKAYEENEKKITSVYLATMKLGASKEDLIRIAALQYASTGADATQVERYTMALIAQNEKEEELAATKEKERAIAAAQKEFEKLDKNNPYAIEAAIADAARKNELAKAQQTYQTKLQMLQKYNHDVIAAMKAAGVAQDDIDEESSQLGIAYAQQERDAKIQFADDSLGAASNMMQNLFVATGSHNKAMFESMKVFAIAQATIKGYQSVVDSYEAGAAIGGPVVGTIYAAVAAAATAAQIQKIASTTPGGASGSINSSGSATPAYSGGSPNAYPVPQTISNAPAQPAQNVTINIHSLDPSSVNWTRIVEDNIVPALNNTGAKNIPININVVR